MHPSIDAKLKLFLLEQIISQGLINQLHKQTKTRGKRRERPHMNKNMD